MLGTIRKRLLTLFILAHLIGLSAYCAPPSPFRDSVLAPFLPYINFCGLNQTWSLFAPNPLKYSTYISATIQFQDGTTTDWEFPRVEKMGLMEKMLNERFRKWANDCVGYSNHSVILNDAAEYAARQNYNPNNPPVQITLIRHHLWTFAPDHHCGSSPDHKQEEIVIFTKHITKEEP